MTEIEIYGTEKRVRIPSCWDEMTPEQVRFVFRTYDRCVSTGASPLEFNVRVLYHLLGICRTLKESVLRGSRPVRAQRIAGNVYRLCEQCLAFMFEKEGEDRQVRLSYCATANPLPVARGRFGRPLTGPADLLQDLTFGEFRHAAVAVNEFFRSRRIADLDECIAILYRRRARKPNRAGRRVAPLDNATMEDDVRQVAGLPSWQKNMIMLWFSSCLKYLQSGTVVIDGETVDMSRMFAGGKSSGTGVFSFGWNDLLVQIARDQSIGNIERVDEEPLFKIFSLMWTNYKENKRNETVRKANARK